MALIAHLWPIFRIILGILTPSCVLGDQARQCSYQPSYNALGRIYLHAVPGQCLEGADFNIELVYWWFRRSDDFV